MRRFECYTFSPAGHRSSTQLGIRLATMCVVSIGFAASRASATAGDAQLRLIAHRGGVVEGDLAENTKPALDEAAKRGYWMVEVDVQESADGHAVAHHDADFKRFYGVPKQLADMNWNEIRKLRTKGGARPLDFADFTEACSGRMRLMIDTKGPGHSPEFYEAMHRAMVEHDLLDSAYFIGTGESKAFFRGKARVSVNRDELRAAINAGEDTARLYFLFEHGRSLDAEGIALARKAGVPVVASVNTFHYIGRDHMLAAAADIRRLKKLGVTKFQIDSVYEGFCKEE